MSPGNGENRGVSKYIGSTVLRQVLDLRLLVARAGESDSLSWWDDHALTQQGQWALERLYPRYAPYAGTRLAIDAAAIVHAKTIGQRPAVTLFWFGAELDTRVMRQLDLLRMDQEALTIAPAVCSPSELDAVLRGTIEMTEEDLAIARSAAVNASLVELGAVGEVDLWLEDKLQTIARRLAAAYTLSDSQRLVVPYYRLKNV